MMPCLPGGVFWLVLFRGRSSKACPSGQGQQPWRERETSEWIIPREKRNDGGVWRGEVKRCLGRGSRHCWKRMEFLGSTWSGGVLVLVGVFSEFSPPSFRLAPWRQWKASTSSHPSPQGCCWVLGAGPLFPSGSLPCDQSLGNHDIAWPPDLSRMCRP